MRIAIVGGSFDPIHNGHIQMANQSLQALQVDEVWFMPTSSTPLKDRELTLDHERWWFRKTQDLGYVHLNLNELVKAIRMIR